MFCRPAVMNLPMHLEAMLESVSRVEIVVDNARRPTQSATDDYYRSMSLMKHTRRERHMSYISSPIPRRQKQRVGAKSPASSPSGRQRPSLRSSLQHNLPSAPLHRTQKKSRWDNSSYDGDVSQESDSPAARPKMPVRSWTSEKIVDDSPSVPVRRGSLDNSLSKLIDDIHFVYLSDNDDDSFTSSTATINTLSPGIPSTTTKDRPPVSKPRIPDRVYEAQQRLPDQSASELIRQVIGELKLYEDSDCNADADFDEAE